MAPNTTFCTLRAFEMIELPEPVAVVCHDAGAANIILAELQATPTCSILPVMFGPALKLWQALGRGEPVLELDDALGQARSVLSGTGWASDLEHRARLGARERGLPSAAVIDHWVNYEARFKRQDRCILSDEIWVTDRYALALAQQTFPGLPVRLRDNLYLKSQTEAIKQAGPERPGRVLYLLEPIRFDWEGLAQAGEFEALDFFAAHLGKLDTNQPVQMRLRAHPSDVAGKYDAWLASHPQLDVGMDDSPTLAAAIAAAEWVVGCETAALPVALAAGKKTASTLPPAAPRCRLPHEGLLQLRDLPGTLWPATAPARQAGR
jgi:hypothetical protein